MGQKCPLKPERTTGRERRISHDVYQKARDHTQALMETEPYSRSTGDRKKIKRLFGEAKNSLSMSRPRPRGLTGAGDAFMMTAIAQNLKRLANHRTRPPPRPMAA